MGLRRGMKESVFSFRLQDAVSAEAVVESEGQDGGRL